jgi:hypothetical protein
MRHYTAVNYGAPYNVLDFKSKLQPVNPAVRSIGLCQAIFDEGHVREGLSGGSGHRAKLPLLLTQCSS